MKNVSLLLCVAGIMTLPAFAQANLSGKWELNVAKSKNIGMMSQMKLIATIQQTADQVAIRSAPSFNGQDSISEIRLDLSGKTVLNKNPMEAEAQTVTKWKGKLLVTTWTSPGSVAGTKSVRIETRSLSPDGRILTVESSRESSPPIVMVYDKQ